MKLFRGYRTNWSVRVPFHENQQFVRSFVIMSSTGNWGVHADQYNAEERKVVWPDEDIVDIPQPERLIKFVFEDFPDD